MIRHPIATERRGRWTTNRCGTAAVEFAILLPFLAIMVIGMFEIGRAIMVKTALTDAARIACRTAIYPGQTDAVVRSLVTNILTDNFGANVASQATITINVTKGPQPPGTAWSSGYVAPPAVTSTPNIDAVYTATRGDAIQVKVSVPVSATQWVGGWFLSGSAVESEGVTMMRQG